MSEKSIEDHIQQERDLLQDPTLSPQMRRHTADELEQLEAYHEHHPEDHHDPTALELYCDANPDALECRVYDD